MEEKILLCVLCAILCVLCVYPIACNGKASVVRGVVVEAVDRDLAEIETLRIRDGDGRVWTFTTEGPAGEERRPPAPPSSAGPDYRSAVRGAGRAAGGGGVARLS